MNAVVILVPQLNMCLQFMGVGGSGVGYKKWPKHDDSAIDWLSAYEEKRASKEALFHLPVAGS